MSQFSEPFGLNISKAKVLLLRHFPFLGHLALSSPIRETKAIPTAGASRNAVYINSEFFNSISLQDQAQVLSHEVLHLAFQHKARQRWREMRKWNLAADTVVNDILARQGFNLLENCITIDRLFSNADLLPPMEDLNVETIYSLIPELEIPFSDEQVASILDLMDDLEGEDSVERINWKFRLKAAARHASLAFGNTPAWMAREIGLTKPRLDWRGMMSYFVGSVVRHERSYRRLSKRHLWRGAIIARDTPNEISLAVVVDASGSISPAVLNAFVNEINSLSMIINTPFRVIVHDVETTLDATVKPGGCTIKSVRGGGGTDFVPTIEKLEREPPDGAVWLTDGYGRYPEEVPSFPVLWVLTRRSYEPPFGWKTKMENL